ncbi:glycoside hydrolase family 1 protein [Zasmidium cellare ATCC 36951]|uniref:Glycoside hydrolase family 1 protein n=1 Tax=Zasmidium cellare ATCC 36951 TaxID=1080233 RepID=A0A6A6CWR5_ZASCE|nr:glycoside hydrolase family 1 protein [Zasmidium cellare ATCC 36951]KAF2171574.1 glycoside hydrolase family 1 protein [Zasmidium cellare ATCC 36951]
MYQRLCLILFAAAATAHTQPQSHGSGHSCEATLSSTPTFDYSNFTYPQISLAKTKPVSNEITPTPAATYALHYSDVSSQFDNLSSTTWPNWTPAFPLPSQSDEANPYGNAALTNLWQAANPVNFTRGIYSTTVSPTPVPSTELVPPPPLYFTPESCYKFPKDFIFGAAGSASQIEGAVADEGKSPSLQDVLANILRSGGPVGDYGTGEHYYLYKQDIERLAAMGLKNLYLTIPMTRILPFALPGTPVNSQALDHYDDVINCLLEHGIQPNVGLAHFDTPLQFYGGSSDYLLNLATLQSSSTYGIGGISFGYSNETFVDSFVNYAQIVMARYGDRVPLWNTYNEPQIGCSDGVAVNNVLVAHARVYHYYKETLKGKGKISMKMGITPAVPRDASNHSHVEAANYFSDLYSGALLRPLALGQDYPQAFKLSVPDHVPLSQADLEYMNGTMDFISLDAYSAPVVEPVASNLTACATSYNKTTNPYRNFPICVNASSTVPAADGDWSIGYSPYGSPTYYDSPHNLRTQLRYTYTTYKLPVFISEFGLSLPAPPGGRLQDNLFNQPASEYLLSYLNEVLKAIWEDGVDVMGALVWNWADDWEFGSFAQGFGLQYVNFTTQERRYRRSFFDVMGFVESRRME